MDIDLHAIEYRPTTVLEASQDYAPPLVAELHGAFAWAHWDAAVAAQDAQGIVINPLRAVSVR